MRGPLLGTPMLWETQWFPPPSPIHREHLFGSTLGTSRAFLCQRLRQGQLCQLRDTMGTTKGLWGSFLFTLVMSLHGCLSSESTWGFEKAQPEARQPLNKQKTCCPNKELSTESEQPKRGTLGVISAWHPHSLVFLQSHGINTTNSLWVL